MKGTKKLSFFVTLFSFLFTICFGQSFEDVYKKGLNLYKQSLYSDAEIFLKEALKYEKKKDTVHFLLGMCAAFQDQLTEAESHFLLALKINNRFEQCYLELGGVYFKQKEYHKAEVVIRKALQINPENAYAHDFLGTLYYINGLTIRALHEWNEINKPVLAHLSFDVERADRKKLILKELRFNPGQMIKPSMIRESRQRLKKIGNISNISFNLIPHKDDPEDFDLIFSFYEEKGFGENFGFFLINSLKDISLKTFHLDYKNLLDRNINIYASHRFDDLRKKSQFLVMFPPFLGLPFYTSFAYMNKREVWNLQEALPSQTRAEERINVKEFRIRFDYIHNDRISYNQYLKFKTRDVGNDPFSNEPEKDLFSSAVKDIFSYGGEFRINLIHNLTQNISSNFFLAYALLYQKEKKRTRHTQFLFTLDNQKIWKKRLSEEAKSRLVWRLRLGISSGAIPIEDRFVLGIGPDTDFSLRAHGTTRGGKLGNSPIAGKFFLSNFEYCHHLITIFPFRIEGGLFLDCAYIVGESSVNYKSGFIFDVGIFSKIYLFKFPFIISYGRNFKERIDAFHLGSYLRF